MALLLKKYLPPQSSFGSDQLVVLAGLSDGQVRLQFAAPTPPGVETIDHYDVVYQVPHITPDNVDGLTPVSKADTVSPGETETLTITGLTEGQTYQFAVRAVFSGSTGAWFMGGWGVAGMALGDNYPADQTVISLGASDFPYTASTANRTYRLTENVTATGTAFTVSAEGVDLDLNGYTLTFGTGNGDKVYGVYSPYKSPTVRNGSIVQGGTGDGCIGVYVLEASLICRGVDITIEGIQYSSAPQQECAGVLCVTTAASAVEVSHCNITFNNPCTDRYTGMFGVDIGPTSGVGSDWKVYHNTITGGVCIGVKAGGSTEPTSGVLIHHNVVNGDTETDNCYGITAVTNGTYVFDNQIIGGRRGIYVDGPGAGGNGYADEAWVHDNEVAIHNYVTSGGFPFAHGIKLEGCRQAKVFRNFVTCETKGNAGLTAMAMHPLDVGVEDATALEVYQNRFVGVQTGGDSSAAYGVVLTNGPSAALNTPVAWLRDNVFSGGYGYWIYTKDTSPQTMATLKRNYWKRASETGNKWHYFASANPPSDGVIEDAITASDKSLCAPTAADVATGGSFDCETRETLTIRVVDGGGSAVSGATVSVSDDSANVQFSGTTDANGIVRGLVRRYDVAYSSGDYPNPVVTDYGPFDVTVSKTGKTTYNDDVTVTGVTAHVVTLQDSPTTSTGAADSTAPNAPTGGVAFARTATAAYLSWTAPTPPSGIHHYLVLIGSTEWMVVAPDETSCSLFGLTPNTAYSTVKVRAYGYNGVAGADLTLPTFATYAETRGAA